MKITSSSEPRISIPITAASDASVNNLGPLREDFETHERKVRGRERGTKLGEP